MASYARPFVSALGGGWVKHPYMGLFRLQTAERCVFKAIQGASLGRVGRWASDAVAEQAFVLSGPAAAIDRLAADRTVLSEHAVPGLKSVILEGTADAPLLRDAGGTGVQVSPASLHDLVTAFGADAVGPTLPAKGPRA